MFLGGGGRGCSFAVLVLGVKGQEQWARHQRQKQQESEHLALPWWAQTGKRWPRRTPPRRDFTDGMLALAPCSRFPWDPILSPLSEPQWARPPLQQRPGMQSPLSPLSSLPQAVSHTQMPQSLSLSTVMLTHPRLRHELTEGQPLQGDALGIPKSWCTLINQLKLLHTTWLG